MRATLVGIVTEILVTFVMQPQLLAAYGVSGVVFCSLTDQ